MGVNVKLWGVVAASVGLAAIVLGFTWLRPSEEERVRLVLQRFARVVAVKPSENVITRAGRVKSELKELVADDVYADVSGAPVRVTNRVDLTEKVMSAPAMFSSAECELTNIVIKVDDSAMSAKVDATARLTGNRTRDGERNADSRGVHFLLRNDGGWKITTIDVAGPKTD
jgi:hypothetical protein